MVQILLYKQPIISDNLVATYFGSLSTLVLILVMATYLPIFIVSNTIIYVTMFTADIGEFGSVKTFAALSL